MSDELDDDVSQILNDLDDLESLNTPAKPEAPKTKAKPAVQEVAKAELIVNDDEDFDLDNISNIIDQKANAVAEKSTEIDPNSREEIIKEHDKVSAEIYDNLKSDRKQIQRVIDICYDKVAAAEGNEVKSVFVEQLVAAVKTMNDATLGQVDVLNSKAKLLAALKQPGSINNNTAVGATFNLSSILEGSE